jgi:ankyrin repeat protein
MMREGRKWILGVICICVSILLCSGIVYGLSKNEELYFAIGQYAEKLSEVKRWIEKGADVNYKSKISGNTPLYLAAEYCHRDIAELLIANGADVNSSNRGGWSILGEVGREHFDEFLALKMAGMTPLHAAAASTCSHYGALELLIANGADVNARTDSGVTPLHMAADSGLPYAVELLIANGADVNARDQIGRTPLQIASYFCRAYIAEVLIKNGADVNARDERGNTVLSSAQYNECEHVIELLRRYGAQ